MSNSTAILKFDGKNFKECVKHLEEGKIISAGKKINSEDYYLNLIAHFKEVFNYKPIWNCREDQSEVIISKK